VSNIDHRGGIWAIIPVKPFAEGKSRLGLPSDLRQSACRAFFGRVFGAVSDVLPPRNILVVSRDDEVMAMARMGGARALREEKGGDLNDALSAGAVFAEERGATGLLSIASDLPSVTAEDVESMIGVFDGDNLVIAPDEDGGGTNAMLMPPRAMPYRHGENSFWRHLDAAKAEDRRIMIVSRSGLSQDIDKVGQYALYAMKTQSQR